MDVLVLARCCGRIGGGESGHGIVILKQKRRNSWPLITGGRKRSTWTSKRQSFHSSVPLILPAQFSQTKDFFAYTSLHLQILTKLIPSLSYPLLSKLHNFSKLFRKNSLSKIFRRATLLLLQKIRNTSLSLSLFLSREHEDILLEDS